MRGFTILRRLLPLACSFLRDRRRWLVAGGPPPRSDTFHQRRAARLLDAITRLGPSFVKLGQLFAGRSDLLPGPYATALATLTDRVPAAPFGAVRPILEEGLGRPITSAFEAFDETPIAAGSLGLVYRARLDGRDVAVKVLRPGVRDLVAGDVAIARRFLGVLVRWVSNAHTRGAVAVVEEFETRVGEEMDFRREAENLRAIRANFSRNPRIRIPAVVDALSSERVLVLEFLSGTRIDRLDPSRRYGGLAAGQVVERLIELYIQMMFLDGFFHADPHPGNLLVTADGVLVLLDFGVVIRVPRERRKLLIDTAFAALRNDPEGVVHGMYGLDAVEPGADRAQVVRLANVLLDLAARRTTTEERVDILTREIMQELHDWPVRLPSDLVYFARTATLIEGIGIRYDPRFNPVLAATPVLFRMRGRLIASLEGTRAWEEIDLPTAVGYLLGRAARYLQEAGERVVELLAGEGHRAP